MTNFYQKAIETFGVRQERFEMRSFYEQKINADGTVCYVPVTGDDLASSEIGSRNITILNLQNRLLEIVSLCAPPGGASIDDAVSIVKNRLAFAEKELSDLKSSFNLAASHRDSYQKRAQEYMKALEDISTILGYPPPSGAAISASGLVDLVRNIIADLNKQLLFCKDHASGIIDQLVSLKKEFDAITKQRDELGQDKSIVLGVNDDLQKQLDEWKEFAQAIQIKMGYFNSFKPLDLFNHVVKLKNDYDDLLGVADRLRKEIKEWSDASVKQYSDKQAKEWRDRHSTESIEKEIKDGIQSLKDSSYTAIVPTLAKTLENLFKLTTANK